MVSFIVLVPVVAILVLLYLLWTYSHWYRRGVPQGNPFYLFGGMNDFALSRLDYLTLYNTTYRKHSKYPFQGVYSFLQPNLFLCDPEVIKEVMTTKFQSFPDTASQIKEDVDPIIARDPFFQTGKEWKDRRAEFTRLMTPARLRLMHRDIVEAGTALLQHVRSLNHESGKGDGADVKDIVTRYNTEVMIRVLLGGKAGSFEDKNNIFFELGKAVFEDTLERKLAFSTVIGAPNLARVLKLRIVPKKTSDFLERVIEDETRKRDNPENNYNVLLDAVMEKMDKSEDKEEATRSTSALIVVFFVEGFESSALVSTFVLLNMAKHPEIQDDLRQKIFQMAPPGTEFPEELVNDLPLLQNCVLETMRLQTPVTMLQRKTAENVTLVASTGEEVLVNKGDIVSVPVYGLHHDSRVFPDPETFDPDRFSDEAQKRMFMGFGNGPRSCTGQRFAVQSISTMVASLLREFRIELSPKVKFPTKFSNHPFFLYPVEKIRLRFVPL